MATCPTCRGDFDAGAFCPRDGTRLAGGADAPILGGRYRLLRKCGQGGMGEVYEAEHVYIRRRVAVKILRRELAANQQAVERLQREAQSTSGLGHPNIVDCFDFGYSDEGQVYLVMDWLEGENLEQRLQRGPVDLPVALDIATQAASGLVEAHERGVIHRDLKPANLFLTRDRRDVLVVKVLDFGIAKLASHQTKLTGTGVLVGTPDYMAPEQALGEAVDARTDVYALGVILYELITGAVPFLADSALAVLAQHTSRMPMLPSARAPDRGISAELEALVMRCLAKSPDDRFGSMRDVVQALDELRGSTAPAPIARPAPRDREPALDDDLLRAAGVGRRRLLPLIAIAVLVLGGAAALIVALGKHRGSRAALPAGDAPPAYASGADAGPPAPDAATAALADAATAPLDGGTVAGWKHAGRGKRFAYVASTPIELRVGQPVTLTIALADLGGPLPHVLSHGHLRATLEIAYFKDHSIVHESTDAIDPSLRVAAEVRFDRTGKHHVHLRLLDGTQVIDEARFDLFVP